MQRPTVGSCTAWAKRPREPSVSRSQTCLGWSCFPVDVALHTEVDRKLEALRGHKLTYVDAASLVLIAKRRFREVWGTDRDLAIEGARVLPVGG